jgi:uncharacterized membrane protein YfcA
MNAGVRISPRPIWIEPVRAVPSVASIEKEKRATRALLAGANPYGYSSSAVIEPLAYPIMTGVAVAAGFVDSIAGGGGLIMMPALFFAGAAPLQAIGTNKLQSVFGTGVALRNYWRSGLVEWRPNRLTVLLVFVGAVVGALVVQSIETRVLNLIIPVLLVASAIYVLLSPRMGDEDAHDRLTSNGYAPIGSAVGFYDGFFGPGTGTFFSTSLVALRGYGLTKATALTKLFNFSSNVASVLLFALGGHMLWLLGLCMAVGAMIGGWLGSHSALKFGARLIRPLLVTISLALTAKLLWGYFAG